VKYIEVATQLITKFKNTGRVFINLTGEAGLFLYSTIPKRLRTIYLKGFKLNPTAFMGLTKSHFVIHTLKILKKYNVVGIVVPIFGLSLLLSLLPLWLIWIIFIGSISYMTFIISRKIKSKFKKGETNSC
jgi:hypothetical protein